MLFKSLKQLKILLFLILLLNTKVQGQSISAYPDFYGQYFNNKASLLNWYIPQEVKYDLGTAFKFGQGVNAKVTTFTFTADRVVSTKRNNNHLFRLLLYNEKNGPYIGYPRAYFNYAYGIKLSEDVTLTAGASLGISTVHFSATSSTADVASTSPDGGIGLGIRRKKLNAGFSMMQLFNSKAQPLSGTLVFRRYYNLFFNNEFQILADWDGEYYFFSALFEDRKNIYDLGGILFYRNFFGAGGAVKLRRGITFTLTLREPTNQLYNLSFSWNTALISKLTSFQNTLEINLRLKLK